MHDRISILRNAVVQVTRILTDSNIKVTQQGLQAFVVHEKGRPKRVNLPNLPENAGDDLIDAIHGFLDHEVAHILFSDFATLEKSTKSGFGQLHNLLEDCFIEKMMSRRFAGCGQNLRSTHEFFIRKVIEPAIAKANSSGNKDEALSHLTVPMMRAAAGQFVFQEYLAKNAVINAEILDPVRKMLGSLLDEVAGMESSQDAFDLAKRMHDRLKKPPEPKPKPEPKDEGEKGESKDEAGEAGDEEDKPESPPDNRGDSDDENSAPPENEPAPESDEGEPDEGVPDEPAPESEGEDGTPPEDEPIPESDESDESDEGDESDGEPAPDSEGESESEGGGSPEGEDEPDEENSKSEEEGKEGKPEGAADADTGESGDDDGEDHDLPTDMFDKLEDMSDAVAGAMTEIATGLANDSNEYLVFTKDYDRIEPLNTDDVSRLDFHRAELTDNTDHMVGTLQKGIERAIMMRSQSVWSAGQRRGRINPSSLHRLASGDDRVFRKREEHSSKDVAVELVVDCSGSMRGQQMTLAAQSAYALSSVLTRIGIANEVVGFTTDSSKMWSDPAYSSEVREEADRIGRTFSRQEPLWIHIFKSFAERMSTEVTGRFAAAYANQIETNNNVDGESIEIAAHRLLQRREKGKIMMVLSDGEPAAYGNSGDLNDHLKATVNKIEASGVKVIGIGIASNAVKKFYGRNIVLSDIGGLPGLVMSELRTALLN